MMKPCSVGGVVVALVLAMTPRLPAAQGAVPNVGELTAALSSPDAFTRARATALAFQAVRSQDANTFIQNSDFQSAALRALQATNEELAKLAKPDPNAAPRDTEGLVANASYLLEVAMRVVPIVPDNTKRAWMTELVASPFNDDSPFAGWLASYGDLVIDPLIARASSNELDGIQRGNAYAVLAQMVAVTAFRPGVNAPPVVLSFANRQRAMAKVNEGLDRKDVEARMIVAVFKKYPSADGLSILQAYHERAQGAADFTRNTRVPSLQHDVEDAISSIQVAGRR